MNEPIATLAARVHDGHDAPSADLRTLLEAAIALEREHQALLRRFTQVLEATNDGIWDWDLVTNEVYFSPRWKGILGYADHEIENTATAFFALIHPDDQASVDGTLKAHFATGSPYSPQFRMRAKDGGWRWIHARGEATKDANGQLVRMAGTHTDVTHKVEQEQALLEAKEQQIAAQREVIAALGCPVLRVRPDLLCVPLIGPIDGDRAVRLTETMLAAVKQNRSRFVVLDLTAAEVPDTSTVEHLLRAIRALRMIGARGVLSGLKPELARMMSEAGGVTDLPSFLTLESALAATAGAPTAPSGEGSPRPTNG